MSDNLSVFGYSYQVKVISSMMMDRDFITTIIDILDPKLFETKALNWICKTTFDYFSEYRLCPTIDVFKSTITQITNNENLQREIIKTLKDVYENLESTDLTFIKNDVFKFCKDRAMRNAITDYLYLVEQGKYDEYIANINKANQITEDKRGFGLDYLNDIDFRYSEQAIMEKIPTGWPVLDEIMNGGLDKGNFGVVIAPTGIGKSWILTCLGAAALKLGKTVIHYTLELTDVYVSKRYDSIISGIPLDDLPYNIPKVKHTLKGYDNKLFIKQFPAGTLSLSGLESHLERYILSGIKPDIVILDYPELMEIPFSKTMAEHKVLGEFYKNLKGLASKLNIALWGADQTNRGGSQQEVIQNESVSSAYAKLFALDFVMTVSRRLANKNNNTAKLHIAKSRLGLDGMTLNMVFDTRKPKFEVYHEKSDNSKTISIKHKQEVEKQEQIMIQNNLERIASLRMNNVRTEPNIDDF